MGLGDRILVYGVTGAGKSSLAARVSAITGIPWHSVDDLTFKPGNWESTPVEEQRAVFGRVCEGDRWILDSAYGTWLDIPLARVETVLGLDYPRQVSLLRLMRRTVLRSIRGDMVCNGNRETLRGAFSRQSIIAWHFKSFDRKRARIRKWSSEPQDFDTIRFRSPRETDQWVAELAQSWTERRRSADVSGVMSR